MKQNKHCHPVGSSWPGGRCSEWRLQGQSNEGATQSLYLGHLMRTNLSFFQADRMTTMLSQLTRSQATCQASLLEDFSVLCL